MVFSKEDKILIKNLRQLKGYTATRFLKEFKTKNWITTTKSFESLLETYNYMLLLSLNFPDANPNLLLGSHRLSAPSDQLSLVLKTSGNAPTLL